MKRYYFFFIFFTLSVLSLQAKITLPALIADNMVLQRETTIEMWGYSDKNTRVNIYCEWLDKQISTTSDAQGKWQIPVNTPEAGGPYKIIVKTKNDQVSLKNILIGDVWFCSGQSNMQMPMKGFGKQPIEGSAKEIMDATLMKNLRLFTVERNATQQVVPDVEGEWLQSNPNSVANTSAIAYLFGKQLTTTLDVPVGIIVSSWGGSSILAWMSRENIDNTLGVEKYKQFAKTRTREQHVSANLFNGMLLGATNYKIKGILWYQGENERETPAEYTALQTAMVSEWRKLWNDVNNELAFYFVQIAQYNYKDVNAITVPKLNEAQQACEKTIPNAYMATTTDVGELLCIHPSRKKQVAERLAMLALQHTYKLEDFVYGEYPRYKEAKFNGREVEVTMDARYGIVYGEITGFEVAGADQVFYPAKAFRSVNSEIIAVSSSQVAKPVAVRYAYRNYIENNLKSIFGVPAPPFRSDNW